MPASAKPSQTSSSVASARCWRCSFLRIKCRLPSDGDWLFSTTQRCRKHLHDGTQIDLDEDFATPERALETFGKIDSVDASKLLFEHAKSRWTRAESTIDATRDKAKVVMGATTVAFAIVTAVAAQVWAIPSAVSWPHILLLAGLVLVVAHFIRALALSLQAITRDVLELPSTQRWAEILRAEQVESGKAYLVLAAETLSSAVATNARLRERVNSVILAQTSFKWALILSPFLLIASATVAGGYGQRKDRDISRRLEMVEKQGETTNTQMRGISGSVSNLDDQLRMMLSSQAKAAQAARAEPQVVEPASGANCIESFTHSGEETGEEAMTALAPSTLPFLVRLSVPAPTGDEVLDTAAKPGKRTMREYATRSYMTDAKVDPTGDEQTDR